MTAEHHIENLPSDTLESMLHGLKLIMHNLNGHQKDADRMLQLCDEEILDNVVRNNISELKNRIVLLLSRAEIGVSNVQVCFILTQSIFNTLKIIR